MIVMWECPYGRIRTNQKTHYCQGCSDDVKRVYDTTYCYFRKTEKSMRNFNPIGFSDFPPIILGIQLVESLRDNPDVAFVLGKMMAFPRCPPPSAWIPRFIRPHRTVSTVVSLNTNLFRLAGGIKSGIKPSSVKSSSYSSLSSVGKSSSVIPSSRNFVFTSQLC